MLRPVSGKIYIDIDGDEGVTKPLSEKQIVDEIKKLLEGENLSDGSTIDQVIIDL